MDGHVRECFRDTTLDANSRVVEVANLVWDGVEIVCISYPCGEYGAGEELQRVVIWP